MIGTSKWNFPAGDEELETSLAVHNSMMISLSPGFLFSVLDEISWTSFDVGNILFSLPAACRSLCHGLGLEQAHLAARPAEHFKPRWNWNSGRCHVLTFSKFSYLNLYMYIFQIFIFSILCILSKILLFNKNHLRPNPKSGQKGHMTLKKSKNLGKFPRNQGLQKSNKVEIWGMFPSKTEGLKSFKIHRFGSPKTFHWRRATRPGVTSIHCTFRVAVKGVLAAQSLRLVTESQWTLGSQKKTLFKHIIICAIYT